MLTNYLKVAIRNIVRHKSYSFINIAGRAVGMACCILIMLWVQDELGYDGFHEEIDTLYRVAIEDHSADQVKHIGATPAPLAIALKDEIPEVIRSTRSCYVSTTLNYANKNFSERAQMADPDFLEMFSFDLIKGDKATALSDPNSIVLSEAMAQKYFGDDEPLGKTLKIDNSTDLTVTGVLKEFPANSSLRFELLVPFEYRRKLEMIDSWEAYRYDTYVQIHETASQSDVDNKISGIIKKYRSKSNDRPYLQPFEMIHLHSNLIFDLPGRGDIKYVWIFFSLAMLIIVIACINFMNLATARSSGRAREIGLRKVVGAGKSNIIIQFLGESVVLSFIALVLAVLLVELLLPIFNELSAKHMAMNYFVNLRMIVGLFSIALFTGILSGIYPALFLSSYKPVNVLKNVLGSGSRGPVFRRILVVVQFSVSIILVIGVIIISRQLDFMKSKDLGFDKEQIIYTRLNSGNVDKYNALKAELLRNPDIVNVTASFQLPFNIGSSPGGMDWEGRSPGHDLRINAALVGYDYFETFNMEMAEGRSFSRKFSTDSSAAYILNEEAVRQMGIESPVGKWFSFWNSTGTIIGVVKDYHSTSLKNEINPIVLKIDTYWMNFMYLKVQSDNLTASIGAIQATWNRFNSGYPFEIRFLDETIDSQYRTEERLGSLVEYFTLVAIFISCLGLFGLASYMARQRTKEMGIRKVLGASVANLAMLLSKEYVILVGIANLIAWPIAYWAMNRWLENYAYRIALTFEIFAVAGVLAVIITWLTVGFQAIKVAIANPVETLRHE
ncbi:MAG: FtsX-like permease family protein [candidate division Zixibacteria bacterium]|nr:FtsX-like permease family protein [candidate division Zixibacteria bacterium]